MFPTTTLDTLTKVYVRTTSMPTDDEDLLYYQGSGSGDVEAEEREDIAIVEEYGNTGCRVFKRGGGQN